MAGTVIAGALVTGVKSDLPDTSSLKLDNLAGTDPADVPVPRAIQRYPSNAQPQGERCYCWLAPSLLGYGDATSPPFLGNSARHRCDAAFSPDALMWLLAHAAAVLRSGPEKS